MPTLQWLTREDDLRAAARVPYRLLEEVPELSVNPAGSENLLVQGDNLEALKALLPFYAGRVKCIFIDPPYNTGAAFTHYDDNLEHTFWLSMMWPRLVLLREFLSNDATVWVTLDDNESHYMKVVMDEIFGRRNFVANVVWQKSDSPRNSARQFSSDHDNILIFARAEDWKPNKLPRDDRSNAIYANPDDDPRGAWLPGDPYANKPYSRGQYTITGPSGRTFSPPPGRFWRISEESLRDLDKDGRIWWGPTGEARPSIKRYLSEVGDLVPRTIWAHADVGSNRTSKNEMRALFPGDPAFDTPKPEAVIQRILHIATNPNDLVLDSFLGSGTTAAVAHKMGRRWIGIEMGDHAVTHCVPRLRKVTEGEQGGISQAVNWQGGGGFRFLRLGETVFDETGRLRPGIPYAALAAHLWFAETRAPRPADAPAGPLLGTHEGRAIALLYNGILGDRRPRGGNVLTRETLGLIRAQAPAGFIGPIIIYGEQSRLSAASLQAEGIVFRQTPHALTGHPAP
jgi:adenine-specific DNA-methyltransferase